MIRVRTIARTALDINPAHVVAILYVEDDRAEVHLTDFVAHVSTVEADRVRRAVEVFLNGE